MKIVGIGSHDYYDGVAPYDQDTSLVFHRGQTAIDSNSMEGLIEIKELHDYIRPLPKLYIRPDSKNYMGPYSSIGNNSNYVYHREKSPSYIHEKGTPKLGVDSVTILFCGKIYNGIVFYRDAISAEKDIQYIWSTEEYFDSLEKITGITKEEIGVKSKSMKAFKNLKPADLALNAYFSPINVTGEAASRISEIGAVIGYSARNDYWIHYERVKDIKWEINTDVLSKVKFQKVFDAWSAYQEIEMFLGTQLVNDQDKMVKISDDSMIKKHGFDKWSFRNQVHRNKPRGKVANT